MNLQLQWCISTIMELDHHVPACRCRPSRIINVASSAHQFGHIHFDNINLRGEYSPWKAYGQASTRGLCGL